MEDNSARISRISREEGTVLESFLSHSVTKGTARNYQFGMDKWTKYLSTLDPDRHPGDYMEKMDNQHEKAQRIVLFMAYLYMNEGLRDEQIKRAVTSVSYMFEVTGGDTSFIDLAMVSRGRSATSRSVEECRAYEEVRGEKVILPLCLDIVLSVRDEYWVNQDWSMKGMDRRAIWLAISLGFDSGLRIGNLTKRDGPN